MKLRNEILSLPEIANFLLFAPLRRKSAQFFGQVNNVPQEIMWCPNNCVNCAQFFGQDNVPQEIMWDAAVS